MNSSGNTLPLIYLKSGEIHYSADPENVYTVLGSCLSVTMLHRPSGKAAICHGVMPECRIKGGCGGACPEPGKYVDCAIRSMTQRFSGLGVSLRELEVKVFGGAATFTRRQGAGEGISVGKRNTAAALQALEKEGLIIASMDVGGACGRKIIFNTQSGEVMLQRLQPRVFLADPAAVK